MQQLRPFNSHSVSISSLCLHPLSQYQSQQQCLLNLIQRLNQILSTLAFEYQQLQSKCSEQQNKLHKQIDEKDRLILSLTKINNSLMRQNNRLKRKIEAQLQYFVQRIAETECSALNQAKKLQQVITNADKVASKISKKVSIQQQFPYEVPINNKNRSSPLILNQKITKQKKIQQDLYQTKKKAHTKDHKIDDLFMINKYKNVYKNQDKNQTNISQFQRVHFCNKADINCSTNVNPQLNIKQNQPVLTNKLRMEANKAGGEIEEKIGKYRDSFKVKV